MNDLESQLREAFRGHEGDAPTFDPSDAPRIAGRTRRRQVWNATVAGIGALVVVVALTNGVGQLLRADGTPADQLPLAPVVSGALAYPQDGDIYVADPDGTNAVAITDVDAIDDACPGDIAYGSVSWSPDGRYLASC